MVKVGNKAIINKVALATLKNNKNRNIIAIIAIALTAILFTTLFTIGFGMKESLELYSMKMVGTTFHGELKNLTNEKYENLKEHRLIKEHGHRRMIGKVVNDEFSKENVEISYGDENYIKRGFSYPTVGSIPNRENEIITDTKILDLLKVPHEVGQKLYLSFEVYDTSRGVVLETIEKEFILSGFYPVNPLMSASMIYTSRDYIETLKLPQDNISLYIMFSNSFNIEGKLDKIITDKGYRNFFGDAEYIAKGVNWGYMSEELKNPDLTVIVGFITILLLIVATGYLIIYNIFQISVLTDIRLYGLLKTLGGTSKQLKTIIIKQTLLLTGLGIPLGLVSGYIIGNKLLPIIVKEFLFDDSIKISFSPLIFLIASIFSLFTVFISIRKPRIMAARVSPIEAAKLGDVNQINYKKEKRVEKEVKLSNMAISNLCRNRLRTAIVILSMSLSLVLFNSIYTFTIGFDAEKVVEAYMKTDFNIGSESYFKYSYREDKDIFFPEIINIIKNTEGFIGGGIIYHNLDVWINDISNVVLEGKLPVQLFGLDEIILSKQKLMGGNIDVTRFMSGNYILIGINNDRKNFTNPYSAGDKVILSTEGGSKEFQVLGMIDEGPHNNARRYTGISTTTGVTIWAPLIYTSSATYKNFIENPMKMVYQFDVEEGKLDVFEDLLKELSEKNNVNYESRKKLLKETKELKKMFLIVGGALSFIIGLVGIINFINSIITSIMSRKQEFALLQSIGMTNRQLKRLLIKEGLIYSFSTMLITTCLATIISIVFLRVFERTMPFYTYKFTILPLLMAFPIVLLLGIIVPNIVKEVLVKDSIIDRIKQVF